jgi:hypothetical protein
MHPLIEEFLRRAALAPEAWDAVLIEEIGEAEPLIGTSQFAEGELLLELVESNAAKLFQGPGDEIGLATSLGGNWTVVHVAPDGSRRAAGSE